MVAARPSRPLPGACRRPAPPREARGPSRPARRAPGNRRGFRSFGARRGTPSMDRRSGPGRLPEFGRIRVALAPYGRTGLAAALALAALVPPAPAAPTWDSGAALAPARPAALRRGRAVAGPSPPP